MAEDKRSDHDLLIKLEANTANLCGLTEKYHKENNATHNEILAKFDKNSDDVWGEFSKTQVNCEAIRERFFDRLLELKTDKVPWKQFKWIVGGLSSIILLGMIYLATLGIANKDNIFQLTETVKTHIEQGHNAALIDEHETE